MSKYNWSLFCFQSKDAVSSPAPSTDNSGADKTKTEADKAEADKDKEADKTKTEADRNGKRADSTDSGLSSACDKVTDLKFWREKKYMIGVLLFVNRYLAKLKM